MKFTRGIDVKKSIGVGIKRKIENPDWNEIPSGFYLVHNYQDDKYIETFGIVKWDKKNYVMNLNGIGWVGEKSELKYDSEIWMCIISNDFLISRKYSIQLIESLKLFV